MSSVTIDNVRKEFGDLVAVEGFDLTVEENEFVTLVGPSGCGKTTTLRMIVGLETPTDGRVVIGDRDVTDLPPQERDMALLFQDIALFPHMSVRDNMEFGLKLAGVAKEERREKIEDVAKLLQIDELLDKPPAELSGGQQQRVALGRSMVRDPSAFLFDEPMSDLDAKLKRELRPLFEEVTREIGCPTLYVTHDQEEAMTMSDRIVVMNNGKIEQIGTPSEIYNNPANEFVAEFMGQPTTQFFTGTTTQNGDGLAVQVNDYTFDIPDVDGSIDPGQSIRIGIRPHDINVQRDGLGIQASHVLDEPLGSETHSFFETDAGRITVVTPPGFSGGRSDYRLTFEPEETMVFDSDSGERIV